MRMINAAKIILREFLMIKRALNTHGGINRKIRYYCFERMAQKNGVADFRINRIADEYTEDFYNNKDVSLEGKKWAHRLGFGSWKIQAYGLTPDTYKNYISDFDFYNKKNYVNKLSFWFDHKLSTYFILAPFFENLPTHHYYISKGEILPLAATQKRNACITEIMDLIREKPIAAKACLGGHGEGFSKLEFKEGKYFQNGQECTHDELESFVLHLDNYIITDYIKPCSILRKACGEESFGVIRALVVYDKNDGPQMTMATIRCGCKTTGFVADYAGTIDCGITLEDGKLFNPRYRKDDYEWEACPKHPDTGFELEEVKIPDWDRLKALCEKVSGYLPMMPYLIFDIIPSDEGFKILEINSHGQVRIMEFYYPFLMNKYNRRVFQTRW